VTIPAADPVEQGRNALARHAWQEAYDALAEADRSGLLSGEGLRMLAEAAWWSGRPEEMIETGERAYEAYAREGDNQAAAMVAIELARQFGMRLNAPLLGGWLARAERLVADDPASPVHGYLACMRGFVAAAMEGDPEKAIRHLDEALAIATRTGDRNVYGFALHSKGWALTNQGKPTEGLALMDEAMAIAVGGEMDPATTGQVYCGMIGMCFHRSDYQRAAEWTEATTRWCERNSITGFPGVCRVHRAGIMRLHGALHDAEEEARRASDELAKFNFVFGIGDAFYEIGEVRRRMGDLAGAEAAFGRAHEYGRDPQPGMSLVRFDQGNPEAAASGVRRALAEITTDRLARSKPLLAQAEIALATGDVLTAETASAELDSIADEVGTTALRAGAAAVRGGLSLLTGDPEGAVRELRTAIHAWQELEAPYEIAETRVALGKAYQALGERESAVLEWRSARDGFERLRAVLAAERAGRLLGELGAGGPAERITRAFMFTDIVKSTDLARAIGDEAWEDLLSWHDQTLRSKFASFGGEVANHTGDGFFVAFPDSAAALRCAVAIQQALAEHRRQSGFSPVVRIGVHTAEATRRGQDYGGGEVHKAARIAALADGWQILASEEALAEAGGFKAGEWRDVELKGISEPVRVAQVEWRPAGKVEL
jgi:class 3 adenylate cyclase